MAGRAAVIMEVDAVFDRQLHEPEHLCALMPHCVAVVADLFRYAKVDPEACAQALHAALQAVAREQRLQSVVETAGYAVDMVVESRLSVGGEGRQSRGNGHGTAVVS